MDELFDMEEAVSEKVEFQMPPYDESILPEKCNICGWSQNDSDHSGRCMSCGENRMSHIGWVEYLEILEKSIRPSQRGKVKTVRKELADAFERMKKYILSCTDSNPEWDGATESVNVFNRNAFKIVDDLEEELWG